MNESTKPDTTRAATDVSEFFEELDGGQFERLASIALSEVSSAVVDREKKGEVSITLKFEHIKGTHQVRIEHVTKFVKPTMSGRASEEAKGATVMHVGRFGRLSLAQPSLLDDDRQKRIDS